jgi:beta-1,2-mannobiose phosphorylase / 1,2-beta-oligomannan phosphorylase
MIATLDLFKQPPLSKLLLHGLGVAVKDGLVYLYFSSPSFPHQIRLATSEDGFAFELNSIIPMWVDKHHKQIPPNLTHLKISRSEKPYLLTGKRRSKTILAQSSDLIQWQLISDQFPNLGVAVPDYEFNHQPVMYIDGSTLSIGQPDNSGRWLFSPIGLPREPAFSGTEIGADFAVYTDQGIFVMLHSDNNIHIACFNPQQPSELLWHSRQPVWVFPEEWSGKKVHLLGTVYLQGKFISYWEVANFGFYAVSYPVFQNIPATDHHHFSIEKHPANPILGPRKENHWESEAVFNPTAFFHDGKVYLLYRAVGQQYISVLGYAESNDGIHFHKRLDFPVYVPREDFEFGGENTFLAPSGRQYVSGGGWGGCEDPRITKIDDKLHMIYVAFDGAHPPRLAYTWAYVDDFVHHRFVWEKPVLISPPGVVDKSGCILPEKVNGKYVILHRVFPNILIDYVDNLNFDGSKWLKGEYTISPRADKWDSRKIGAGAPPVKTEDGWLLIYQAVDDKDPSKYKIGAMLLDLNDPTKVLHRTNHPILEPTEHYENHGAKFGVVYPCGAVVIDGQLIVYYGGSDNYVCVATANLAEFLKQLKSNNEARVAPLEF